MANPKDRFQCESSGNTVLQNRIKGRSKNEPALFVPAVIPFYAVMICCVLTPEQAVKNGRFLYELLERTYSRDIAFYVGLFLSEAAKDCPSLTDSVKDAVAEKTAAGISEDILRASLRTFADSLNSLRKESDPSDAELAGLADDVLSFCLDNATLFFRSDLEPDWGSLFAKCGAFRELCSIGSVNRAGADALREAGIEMTGMVNGLIKAAVADCAAVKLKKARSREYIAAAGEAYTERRFGHGLWRLSNSCLLDMEIIGSGLAKRRASVPSGTDYAGLVSRNMELLDIVTGGKTNIIRQLIGIGCRAYNVMLMPREQRCDPGSFMSARLNDQAYARFLIERDFTVRQFMDYTVGSMYKNLTIYTPRAYYAKLDRKLESAGVSPDDSVITVIFGLMKSESDKLDGRVLENDCSGGIKTRLDGTYREESLDDTEKALAVYIQLSVSKMNNKIQDAAYVPDRSGICRDSGKTASN